jgi:hypothetical protein
LLGRGIVTVVGKVMMVTAAGKGMATAAEMVTAAELYEEKSSKQVISIQ